MLQKTQPINFLKRQCMSKKIFVYDNVLSPSNQRGVNRCFISYTQALAKSYPNRVLVYTSRSVEAPGARFIYSFSRYIKTTKITSKISILKKIPPPGIIADLFTDIVYLPYYGKIRTRIPQLFSAYDMIYEKYPHYFSPSNSSINKHIQEKKECFERAALILCISNNTAKDIIEIYPNLPKDKFKVIHLGVDDIFFNHSSSLYTGKPYFLYVGIRRFYKNFNRLLRAFGKSELASRFDLKIITTERYKNFTDQEVDIINKYNLSPHINIETSVTDNTLRERYSQSFAFVYPSEYEGFGLPVLEAMASGTLVLTSNVSSMPEIGGDAPLYFDPLSEDSIAQTLLIASQMSEIHRQEYILKGITRARQFTWQSSQEKFLSAIQQFQ